MAGGKKSNSIFTALGAATGLGNALRFPSLCALYGGGFVIAYVVCLALVCYPLLCAELYLGKRYALSFEKSLKKFSPRLSSLAHCAAINCAVFALYYSVISAKIGGALVSTAIAGTGGGTDGILLFVVGAFAVCLVGAVLCGPPSLMARTGKIAVISSLSLFFILALLVAVRGGDVLAPFRFDFGDLARGGMWADALGQSLLALSLAGGVMPTFARSFKEGFGVVPAALKIISANLAGCLLSAISALGFALPVPEGGSVIIALQLYPNVIAMAIANAVLCRIFTTLFFSALLLVAIQSTCSLFAPVISFASENRRRVLAVALCLLSLALFPLFAANGGMAMLAVDRMACSVNAVVIAFLEALIFVTPRNIPRLTREIGVATCVLLALFCPLSCGALALFSVCSARFSAFPPYAVFCAAAALIAAFAPLALRLVRFLYSRLQRAAHRLRSGSCGSE